MLAAAAALCFLLALVFRLSGPPHEAVLQPDALAYLGLALLALHLAGAGWPLRRPK